MPRLLTHGLALALFVALFAAPDAFAQQTPPQTPPPTQQAQPPIEVSEGELNAFAEAYLDIEALQATYEQRLGGVEDPAEAQQIQEQFNVEAMQTLRSEERRVGKECRSRGSAEHEKKKEQEAVIGRR